MKHIDAPHEKGQQANIAVAINVLMKMSELIVLLKPSSFHSTQWLSPHPLNLT